MKNFIIILLVLFSMTACEKRRCYHDIHDNDKADTSSTSDVENYETVQSASFDNKEKFPVVLDVSPPWETEINQSEKDYCIDECY